MLALEGIKVLDLADYPPGALCTMVLGDLGAEVIKIEAPTNVGERGAWISAAMKREDAGRQVRLNVLDRNKRSMSLNLRADSGKQILCKLAEKADVMIEGFRPGTVKKLGVDYESISKINPRIVYCSLSGYGQDGPYRDLPGHDINYVSIAGALNLIGKDDGAPVVPLNLLADYAGASLHGVIGILAALWAREKTGKGQYVDISFTDGVMTLMAWFLGVFSATGSTFSRGSTALHGIYPYFCTYETKDGGYISLGCMEPWFWQNLCRALGEEEYIKHGFVPDHVTREIENSSKWEEVFSHFRKIFLTKTRGEWFELLSKHDVPVAKVNTIEDVFNDPQILHRQMIVETEHPVLGKVKQAGIAVKLSETPGQVRTPPPLAGEHTEEILRELAYKQGEIDKLRQDKIIA